VFQVSGKTIDFPGYLRAYVEGSDDPEAELADQETHPAVGPSGRASLPRTGAQGHTTQPPAASAKRRSPRRWKSGHRPAEHLRLDHRHDSGARNYVFKKATRWCPPGRPSPSPAAREALADLVDYEFTAQMEDELDAISRGEIEHVDYLRNFYFRPGDGIRASKSSLIRQIDEIDARDVSRILARHAGRGHPPRKCSSASGVTVRFIEQGERSGEHSRRDAARRADPRRPWKCSSKPPRRGAAGILPRYAQAGLPEGRPLRSVRAARHERRRGEAQNASLLKGMQPHGCRFETALKLLSLPRTSGRPSAKRRSRSSPTTGASDRTSNAANETRSLPADISPLDVTLEQAVELLAQPKRGRASSGKKEPIKVFAASPVTGVPVQLLNGRYGPYVTDGATNAQEKSGEPEDSKKERHEKEDRMNNQRGAPPRACQPPFALPNAIA
jgi:DNA topoisomerase I